MKIKTIEQVEQDIQNHTLTETATFGMGCFWGPEARFGSLPGVIRTRTGYTGGTIEAPTYRQMGDHTETVEVDFDTAVISFEDILREFWQNHYPNRDEYKGRQYISLLRYHSENQRTAIETVKNEMERQLGEPIETDIGPFKNFTLAEERHQKYYLKRYPKVVEQLTEFIPNLQMLVHSTFAARLNGFVKGFGTREGLMTEINTWNMPSDSARQLIDILLKIKW